MGMNYVAICYQKFDIKILCFCLMANHFHFILYGTYEQCLLFGNEYKRLCAIMMKRMQNIESEILYSRASVPGDYILDENLMISPLCYVDYKAVEATFGHPARLLGLLAAKKEAEIADSISVIDAKKDQSIEDFSSMIQDEAQKVEEAINRLRDSKDASVKEYIDKMQEEEAKAP